MEIEKALERIELQLKAIWWDNLMYCCYILAILSMIVSYLTNQLCMMIVGGLFAIITYPVVQIFENIQKNKIKEIYKK